MISDEGAIKTLKNADKQARDSAKALDKVKDTAAKAGKAIAVGIGAAVTSLTAMAFKSAEATDRVDKLSQKIGLSRQGFQEWDYIMSQSGMSVDQLQMGFKTLVTQIDQAVSGSGKGAESFKQLGISVTDTNGKVKNQETIFNEAVIALQGMEEGTEKAKLANDLFGRSGAEMMPLLNGAAGSVEELRKKANDLGLVLSDEAIDSGVKFTDTMDSMKRSLGAVVTEVGVEVMPILQKMMDWVIEHMPEIKQVVSDAFDKVADVFAWAKDNANWLIPVLATMLGGFLALKVIGVITTLIGAWNAITAAATGVATAFGTVLAFITSPIGLVVVAIAAVIAIIVLLVMNFDKVKEAASNLWDSIKLFFGKIGDFIGNIFDGIKGAIKLPKFKIEGSMNPLKWLKEGVPKLKVQWNAEGGIFKRPTIFNTVAGLQGVGEAGAEAIMPLSKLDSMLENNRTEIDYGRMGSELKKALVGMRIVLDRKEVGEFVDARIIKGVM